MKTQKLDATFTNERLVFALTLAITDANRALNSWQVAKETAGYSALTDVPAVSVNNVSTLVTFYKQAVYSFTKANLLEKYRDYDTTNQGGKKADNLEPNIDIHRRDARWAIADFTAAHRAWSKRFLMPILNWRLCLFCCHWEQRSICLNFQT